MAWRPGIPPLPAPVRRLAFTLALLLLVAGCDGGLQPPPAMPPPPPPERGIRGTVTFRGTRPPPDSQLDLRVVAFFQKVPLDSVFYAIAGGEAFFSPSLMPVSGDSASYRIDTPAVHRYAYIVVAQQYGANIFADWRAVGVYAPSGDPAQPGTVTLDTNTLAEGVDIVVDYDHLPPQ